MTIIETISRQVPNNKEGKEYLKCWLQDHEDNEDNEYIATEWYEDVHGITMMETYWLEGYGREMNTSGMTNEEKNAIEMQNTIVSLAPLIADMLTDDEELKKEFTAALLQTKVVSIGECAYTVKQGGDTE